MKDLLALIRIQARIATFLAELTVDRLAALADGRARLAVVDAGDNGTAPSVPAVEPAVTAPPAPRTARAPAGRTLKAATVDAEGVAERLRSCASVDQGAELLADLKLSVASLKEVARALNIPTTGTKDVLTRKILTLTLASRGKHAALSQG